MTCVLRYLTHPQVLIDPLKPVGDWSLSDIGRRRTLALAGNNRLSSTTNIVSSDETKAVETAQIISEGLGKDFIIKSAMHENDRSATGFLPPAEFEKVADSFFTNPSKSILGWERAIDAQSRIAGETSAIISNHNGGDLLLIGHGAVGTLLYCHLANQPIDRKFDQPAGGGNYFTADLATLNILHHWQPMEKLIQGSPQ